MAKNIIIQNDGVTQISVNCVNQGTALAHWSSVQAQIFNLISTFVGIDITDPLATNVFIKVTKN